MLHITTQRQKKQKAKISKMDFELSPTINYTTRITHKRSILKRPHCSQISVLSSTTKPQYSHLKLQYQKHTSTPQTSLSLHTPNLFLHPRFLALQLQTHLSFLLLQSWIETLNQAKRHLRCMPSRSGYDCC